MATTPNHPGAPRVSPRVARARTAGYKCGVLVPVGPMPAPDSLQECCRDLLDGLPDALVVCVVDLKSAMILAREVRGEYDEALFDLMAEMAADLFAGPRMQELARRLGEQRGMSPAPGASTLREAQLNTGDTHHLFRALLDRGVALVLVTRATANLGRGWAAIRNAVPRFMPHLP